MELNLSILYMEKGFLSLKATSSLKEVNEGKIHILGYSKKFKIWMYEFKSETNIYSK